MSDDDDAPPDWAGFFSAAEYAQFLAAVREVLRAEGFEDGTLDDALGTGVVKLHGPDALLGLRELAQICRGVPRVADWPAAIARYVDGMIAGRTELDALPVDDFDAIRDRVKVRLYSHAALDAMPPALVRRNVAEGLDAVLVLDLPETIVTVSSTVRQKWDIEDDALFDIARDNVERMDAPSVEDIELSEDVPGRALVGDSFFTASHLLHIARYVDPPERGLLVGVPHRHVVVLHRIEDRRVVHAIRAMLAMVRGMHHEGPGSISDQLYWWRDGRITLLPSEIRDGRLVFTPPDKFVTAVMNPLVG